MTSAIELSQEIVQVGKKVEEAVEKLVKEKVEEVNKEPVKDSVKDHEKEIATNTSENLFKVFYCLCKYLLQKFIYNIVFFLRKLVKDKSSLQLFIIKSWV